MFFQSRFGTFESVDAARDHVRASRVTAEGGASPCASREPVDETRGRPGESSSERARRRHLDEREGTRVRRGSSASRENVARRAGLRQCACRGSIGQERVFRRSRADVPSRRRVGERARVGMASRATDPGRDASRDVSSEEHETNVTLRIAETATRLKHRVSLVATLPAVRRLRNFLNPHSRLPDSDKDMILLGERYERTKRRNGDDEDKKNEVDAADADDADPGLVAFLCDLRSRVWITYRRGFPAIASDADRARAEEAAANGVSVSASVPSASTAYGRPYQYTTDAGWGCTLRVGQMLLANALSFHFFGRGYRRRKPVPGVPGDAKARDLHDALVSWFGDDPDADACPFSIHEVYRWGRGELGDDDAKKKNPRAGVPGVVPGRWLGPCVMAQAIAAMTNARRPGGMCAYVLAGEDGGVGGGAPNLDPRKVAAFAKEASRAERAGSERNRKPLRLPGAPFDAETDASANANASSSDSTKNADCDWVPTLVLVPLVLGVDRFVNEMYVPSVAATLRVKQSLGVLGGKPGSSLYLVGAQEDRLFYLDPHTVFPFRGVSNDAAQADSAERNDASTYACDDALHMDARELDPSMVLGFYCRTRGDLDELCLELELLQRRAGAAPLLTVASARDLSRGTSVWKPVGAKTRGATETAPEPTRGSQSELSREAREEEAEARDAESEDDEWEFL